MSVISISTLSDNKNDKDIFSIGKIHLLILSCEQHQFQYSSSMVYEMRFTQDLAVHKLLWWHKVWIFRAALTVSEQPHILNKKLGCFTGVCASGQKKSIIILPVFLVSFIWQHFTKHWNADIIGKGRAMLPTSSWLGSLGKRVGIQPGFSSQPYVSLNWTYPKSSRNSLDFVFLINYNIGLTFFLKSLLALNFYECIIFNFPWEGKK